jgi:hypothetical protein
LWGVFTLIHPAFVQTLAGFMKGIALFLDGMNHVVVIRSLQPLRYSLFGKQQIL